MAKSDSTSKKNWFDGLKAEFRKVIWPNKEDITKETTAVVVCSAILGVIIVLIDFIVQNGIDFLINIGL